MTPVGIRSVYIKLKHGSCCHSACLDSSVLSNEVPYVVPSRVVFFTAGLRVFGELFHLRPLLPTPRRNGPHTHTHTHIKGWPPVTPLVLTWDVDSSCCCSSPYFISLHVSVCIYDYVCVCVCVRLGAICLFSQIQHQIGCRKQKSRAKTVRHSALQSEHMPFTPALGTRRKRET